MRLFFALTIIGIALVLAQQSTYCTTAECALTVGSKTRFYRGANQMAQVWLHVTNAPQNSSFNGTYPDGGSAVVDVKAAYYPLIDYFSVLTINASGVTYGKNDNVRIYLSIGGVNSTMKKYSTTTKFVGYWTAFVNLANGVVTSITWDDDPTCSYCASTSACLDSTCALNYDGDPINNDCSGTRCDMLVYLCWQGTDSAGNWMTSANAAFSRMRLFAISPLYDAAASWVLTTVYDTIDRLTGGGTA